MGIACELCLSIQLHSYVSMLELGNIMILLFIVILKCHDN